MIDLEIDGFVNPLVQPVNEFSEALKVRVFKGRDALDKHLQDRPGHFPHQDIEDIERMSAGVAMNDLAVDLLLYGRSDGVAQCELLHHKCQARIDWLQPNRGIVKIIDHHDIDLLPSEAIRQRIHYELAFARSIMFKLTGCIMDLYVIGSERNTPFRCGVWKLSHNTISHAETANAVALRQINLNYASDKWPTGYEELRDMEIY